MFFSCLGIAWSIWDGVRLCFNNVSATFFFLNALPVPMLRQVFQNSFFNCMGVHFRRIMAPNPETFPGTLSGRSQGHFWFTFGLLLGGPGVIFGCLMVPLGSFGVCLASSGDSFG